MGVTTRAFSGMNIPPEPLPENFDEKRRKFQVNAVRQRLRARWSRHRARRPDRPRALTGPAGMTEARGQVASPTRLLERRNGSVARLAKRCQ
jgi:hypothetical protein